MNNRPVSGTVSVSGVRRTGIAALKIAAALFVVFQLAMASWWAYRGEITFSNDIARDFMLLDELDRKKVILIGPNSSTGLFHGPLWTYLNYPAYKLGGGNPVTVGWFWVGLIAVFAVSNFFIARSLFGRVPGFLFAALTSLYMVFHASNMYNPHGAMLLAPAFFFLFVKYIATKRWPYLVAHILAGCAMIQFQMAVGIPLLGLSCLAVLVSVIRNRKYAHIAAFFLIPLSLANFVLFDFRHDHVLSGLLMRYLQSPGRDRPDYLMLLGERIRYFFGSAEIFHASAGYWNTVAFTGMLMLLADMMRRGRNVLAYRSFLYLYGGFFVLSMINTGPILYFYLFPMFPIIFLILASLWHSPYRKIYLVVFLFTYALNFRQAWYEIIHSADRIGYDQLSWTFYRTMTERIFAGGDREFGYFVYTPNVLAYEGKYTVKYLATQHPDVTAAYFTKKPVTYVIAAPPPSDNPHMKDEWWRINRVRIDASPSAVVRYPNGYKVEKYVLTDAQVSIPFDPGIDPGLSFR